MLDEIWLGHIKCDFVRHDSCLCDMLCGWYTMTDTVDSVLTAPITGKSEPCCRFWHRSKRIVTKMTQSRGNQQIWINLVRPVPTCIRILYTVYIRYWILFIIFWPHTAEAASVAAGIVGGAQFSNMAITFTYLHFSRQVRLQVPIGSVAAVLVVACSSSAVMSSLVCCWKHWSISISVSF